jgi:endogenous inhibitor of DNA gyrase (YacG/DUF329 family)
MKYRARTLLDDAIKELIDISRECPNCHRRFVYGRKGSEFCSSKCARAAVQRRYRKTKKEKKKRF